MKKAIIITLSLLTTTPLFSAAHPLSTDGAKHLAAFMQSKTGPMKFVVPSSKNVQSFFEKLKTQSSDKKPLLNCRGVLWQISAKSSNHDGTLKLSSIELFSRTGFERKGEVTGDIFVTYTDSNNPSIQTKLELFPRRTPKFDFKLEGGDLKYASLSHPSIQKFMLEPQTPNDIVFSGTPKKIERGLYNIIEIKSKLTIIREAVKEKK